ncbi:MAG: sigma-54 interaction domain-containing protein [Bacteroidota bacterium]
MSHLCYNTGRICIRNSEFPLLFEISTMMNKSDEMEDVLYNVTERIAHYISAQKVLVTILDREKETIFIEVGYGISKEKLQNISYSIGEGIIGEVIKKGIPIYVPKINTDSRFLNKTESQLLTQDRKDLSFTCVPIRIKEAIVGTISIERKHDKTYDYKQDIGVLSIIGTLIAETVKARQGKVEEIEILKRKNTELELQLKDQYEKPVNIIGNSSLMKEVYKQIHMVAPTNASVLIRGESGSGKELVAEAIHRASSRHDKPFIKVNCAALPDTLIESELLGHEKGAFTGAHAQKKGRFELADTGTIFLDELGDLPPQTQVKLLRIIQQKQFERVGGVDTLTVNVRIIAATNRNLENLIETGEFREDLFYRINVFPITLPPLRDRVTDIPLLVDHFIEKTNQENGTQIRRISSSAIDMLMIYKWPGNIRELENTINRASIMSTDNVIRSHNLPPTLQTVNSSGTKMEGTFKTIVGNLEKQLIIDTLTTTNGNINKASAMLDITERMMSTRIQKYGINPKRYKLK